MAIEIPKSVTYRERLSPTGDPVELTLPSNRHEAREVAETILSLYRDGNEDEAMALTRAWTASDLYVLGLLSSASLRINPYTDRPEIDHDFQFEQARQIQFDCDRVVDTTARAHWKSTWKTFLKVLQMVFLDPELTIVVFSETRELSYKHVERPKTELQANELFLFAWFDVLWRNPMEEAKEAGCSWSVREGWTVRRTTNPLSPTMSGWGLRRLPTGGRYGLIIYDDIENESTVSNDDTRAFIISQLENSTNLKGTGAEVWANGTYHHPSGPTSHLIESMGFRERCYTAEDKTRPDEAPDLAALYDELEGIDPGTGRPLPVEFRNQQMVGPAVFLHPVQIGIKRVEQDPATYAMQNLGDATGGLIMRFNDDWLNHYDPSPEEMAEGANIYLVSDPSKGITDPWVILAFAARRDKTLALVDAIRRRAPVDEYYKEAMFMASKWSNIGARVVQFRIEEYGQANFAQPMRSHWDSSRFWGCPIYGCSTYGKEKRVREWNVLQPLLRHGKILFPKTFMVADESGRMYDLVDYAWRHELKSFPKPRTDDIIAAMALIGDTKGRLTGGTKRLDLTVEYPASGNDEWGSDIARQRNEGSGSWMTEMDEWW